jgi:hypothetical protein
MNANLLVQKSGALYNPNVTWVQRHVNINNDSINYVDKVSMSFSRKELLHERDLSVYVTQNKHSKL